MREHDCRTQPRRASNLDEAVYIQIGAAPTRIAALLSGEDKRALDAAIADAKKADGAHRWKRGEPSLEDVFILLMDKSKDNYA